ncbi:hypothetical protein LS68_008185 [Helicobacter sp. MIT 05-5293]|uniref:hypothetical protein n=1 Tax=Helicobacter sp. MIT 05-5293 TaxID=1548149 RepID=UPI00051CFC78|nr:hypothetical protein [Helicobacter sp. MIT 05-5293]TLD80187.1 hypothetical protein LS68_008185 [Helicobacter sp. MIT 05-5293]
MQKWQKDIFRFTRNALNRTITQCAKAQRELIQQDYALSNKKIRNLTKIKRAKQDQLEATLSNTKVKLSINNFKRFQNKQGVRVKIAKGKEVFFKGAFLGLRKGQSKATQKRNSGFMAIKNPNESQGFQTSKATIYSYKNTKTPRGTSLYYLKTKEFSLIALDKTKALQKQACDIFKKELSKE